MRLLTVAEVAALLRCMPRTIYDKVKTGELPYRKDGRRVLFVESEILAHIDRLPGVRIDPSDVPVRIAVTPRRTSAKINAKQPHTTIHARQPFRIVEPRGRG